MSEANSGATITAFWKSKRGPRLFVLGQLSEVYTTPVVEKGLERSEQLFYLRYGLAMLVIGRLTQQLVPQGKAWLGPYLRFLLWERIKLA